MNTQDFLNGLDKLTFDKFENDAFHTKEGFEIRINFELMADWRKEYPVQLIFRIRKNGLYIMNWGCNSNDDNSIAALWWQKKEAEINREKYKLEDIKRDELKNEFNKITNI